MSPFANDGSGGSGGGVDLTLVTRTPPVLANLSQVNINGIQQTATQVGDTVVLSSAGAGPNDLSILAEDGPSANWQFTVGFRYACGGPAGSIGPCFINGTNGQIILPYLIPSGSAGGFNWGVNLNNSPTTFNRGVSAATGIHPADVYWFRLRWDGVSMRIMISATGNEGQFATFNVWTPTADFGWAQGPSRGGVFVASNGSAIQATAQIVSWLMESLV